MLRLTTHLNKRGEALARRVPWTRSVGVGRSLLALSGLLTLLFNDRAHLFAPAQGISPGPHCSDVGSASIYCLLPSLDVAYVAACLILVLAVVGWRPRIVGPLHWWVAWSFQASATLLDGGDQVHAILTLLLLPICLTDPRKWHWSAAVVTGPSVASVVAGSAAFMIRVQVSVIYIHAAVAKLGVPEWVDGSAMYYIFQNPYFGAPSSVREAIMAIISSPLALAAVTWGSVAFEAVFGLSPFFGQRAQRVLLALAILFHVGIGALLGLTSFAIAMIAADILFLGDSIHLPERIRQLFSGGFVRRPALVPARREGFVQASDRA